MPRIALTVEELKLRPRGTKSQAANEPSLIEAGRPRAPRHLCAEAAIEFRRMSKLLGRRKTETEADGTTLAVYAETYSRWVEAKKILSEEGLRIDVIVLDCHGVPHTNRKLNPMIAVVERAERNVLALAKSLGVSPDTRDKVKPAKHAEPKKNLTPEEAYFADADARRAREFSKETKPS